MIDYETFCQIKKLQADSISARKISQELRLHIKTVNKYMEMERFVQRKKVVRKSKLDPYKPFIRSLLEQHFYSAAQILHKLRDEGYTGGYTIVKEYVRKVQPKCRPAFLTLSFAPGECAQIDWGYAGMVQIGQTKRRLSIFAMVLCYSRMLYVTFTLSEAMEQFLACQRRAFEFFGGVPHKVMVDNCKTAVISRAGGEVQLNARYLDFANHYGFRIVACNVRAGNEKGRVESAIGYIKKSLLNGMDLGSFDIVLSAGESWRDQIANVRIHGQTRQRPVDMFEQEKSQLQPLPIELGDCFVIKNVGASSQFRVTIDTNRYSVPAQYASVRQLTAHIGVDQLYFYCDGQLIAQHQRCYDRHQDIEDPDHARPLLQRKQKAQDQQLWRRYLALGKQAETYYFALNQRRPNAMAHVRRILALADIYGADALLDVMADSSHHGAFGSDYLSNLLELRSRPRLQPSPLHLTRNQDLLDLELEPPNLDIYDNPSNADQL